MLIQGRNREEIEQQMGQLRASSEEQARLQLKQFFIMAKVSDKLEIEVSEEEINGHIAQVAAMRGKRPEKMREELIKDGSLAQFSLQVREEKCIDKLLETAKITEVEETKEKKTAKKAVKKTAKKAAKKSEEKTEEKKAVKKAVKKTAKKTTKKKDSDEDLEKKRETAKSKRKKSEPKS